MEIKKYEDFKAEELSLMEEEYEIVSKIIQIRNEQSLSQRELAKKIGITQPALARLESKRLSPKISTILNILIPLGYTLEVVPIKNKRRT